MGLNEHMYAYGLFPLNFVKHRLISTNPAGYPPHPRGGYLLSLVKSILNSKISKHSVFCQKHCVFVVFVLFGFNEKTLCFGIFEFNAKNNVLVHVIPSCLVS